MSIYKWEKVQKLFGLKIKVTYDEFLQKHFVNKAE